jgi:hypothetical protein
MSPLFTKLNLKDQTQIAVLESPASFEVELATLAGITVLRELKRGTAIRFALAFVTTRAGLDRWSKELTAAAEGDAILWIAYPKGSSKRYRCEFNRDSGWDVLGRAGWEPVRLVAIDEDWSALRFRRVEHVGTMTRDPESALSSEGKAKAKATRAKRTGAGSATTQPPTAAMSSVSRRRSPRRSS